MGHRYAAQLAAMKDNAYMQLRSVDILDVTQRITNISATGSAAGWPSTTRSSCV